MDYMQNDLSDKIKELMDSLSEVFRKIGEAMRKIVSSFSKFFNLAKQINERKHKVTIGYYSPPKNQYLKSKIPFLYRVEQKIQRHLPYQRRIY